mmetsp:Transcript_96208/g.244451  ORF Transcript_96208/g.244451 Transcript_96208/m.244451 type:complete len:201 (-) Transcript_96208:1135-1737(-)
MQALLLLVQPVGPLLLLLHAELGGPMLGRQVLHLHLQLRVVHLQLSRLAVLVVQGLLVARVLLQQLDDPLLRLEFCLVMMVLKLLYLALERFPFGLGDAAVPLLLGHPIAFVLIVELLGGALDVLLLLLPLAEELLEAGCLLLLLFLLLFLICSNRLNLGLLGVFFVAEHVPQAHLLSPVLHLRVLRCLPLGELLFLHPG